MIDRLSALVNFKANSTLSFFAGPSFNLYDVPTEGVLNEQQQIVKNKPGLVNIGNNKGWIGWTVGISFL
ncbi:hypothetical protein [Pedobacter hartonius]|uniref:Uncharacterized protein n=1 Tax=Pedobacter hartonius TaxID=425514 RepID=A0A1H4BRY1_9SPHI|nr:hypothetical protein [Pedobacter hartonius]SEA50863.1 hypothetical protein SAMN05443550_103448 [Pedobacter hartonius]